ncbi:ATP-binding cassette domain-containing protein [Streptococcus pseudoporcinus]|uniref:ABC transporter ATP-binding protein n=1 Tax=Streptococcus pseudoporcinus TaxID=361101 RepID=A0A4U9XIV0_9STRE|nr:ABC transporter ATP-binding protein [Streptococcus pseudoporcinus]VTS12906.1 ABC transporter ATP-binding protein [Streptococcus pseudoporcinus]VUC65959.1 ABC transporter ATP-binding protein [Streptococcus pseudoporcinus]VUC96886.1 ABC transporter ATP-binding protein [Streptococcus pseudoporcinus]VUC97274.1 ABC transporter ATP-binding protein [Streptococcus pseudoporcinus]
MLEIINGYKYKGNTELLTNISLKFDQHHVYGLVGINGSGKTMLLRVLSGFTRLDRGTVIQDGIKIGQNHSTIVNAGIVLGNQDFLNHLTLEENLNVVKNICCNRQRIDLDYWINLYEIEKFKKTLYKHLSLGTRKKMLLIQAFMDYPRILILDEPMNALDIRSVEITKELIRRQREKGFVIMTSHYKNDIDDLCDTIIHVQEGKILNRD